MSLIVSIGYKCPVCGRYVVVLRSDKVPAQAPFSFPTICTCGYVRELLITELQELDSRKIFSASASG